MEIETRLEKLMEMEEIYWRQKGGEKWILEGDNNTTFFHLVANGRRRKKIISCIENEGVNVTDPEQIQKTIYEFYKKLFGKQPERNVTLGGGTWQQTGRLTPEENEGLTRPFTEEEVRKCVFDMKENTAPGPDGFSVTFYRKCWAMIKTELMGMVNDFFRGNLDIARLNYGVITLIPKVQDANTVKQFRPICLLNVSFKIFTELLSDRLANHAYKLISNSQTAFIRGRHIIDGAVILHETMHELKSKKLKG
jgi:hypothetical protein